MARRPGRDGLSVVPRPADRGRLILALQGVLIACLAIAVASFLSVPVGDADCCLPIAVASVLPAAEIVLVLLALGLRWWSDRWGPIALVDGVIAAPLPVFIGFPQSAELPWIGLIAAVAFVAAMAGAILSILEARRHPFERIAVAVGFAALALVVISIVVVVPVPLLLLGITVWPTIHVPAPTATEPPPVRSATPSPGRVAGPALRLGRGGRLEPDVRAILGERRADDAASAAAAPDESPVDDRAR